MKELMHYEFPKEAPQIDGTMAALKFNISAVVADTTEQAVVQAIKEAAQANGVTDLYVMDKKFVLDALQEKLERDNPMPLTFAELIQMQEQPVWVKSLEDPEHGVWGIIEGASEIEGKKYLFLRGEYGYCEYEKGVVAYRYKPKEEEE